MSDAFRVRFGRPAEIRASAPGRVNLIGEHTDYNGGVMLPMALPLETTVDLARRADRLVHVFSADVPGQPIETYELGCESRAGRWLDYIQAVTHILTAGGYTLGGFEASIVSTVPVGKGLSSSAALQVSLCRALRSAYGFALTDVDVAKMAHRAETEFVGAPVGIMDQMACSLAGQRDALLIDAATGAYTHVPLPPSAGVGVIDSGIAHEHASGDYRTRRAECERASTLLGVGNLSELSVRDLPQTASLPGPLSKRVRHVVTENARVRAMVSALRSGDLRTAGALCVQSHDSMRDDFEMSVADIDRLVALACAQKDVYGARMTGGGFGGAVVVLGRADTIAGRVKEIAVEYERITHREGRALLPVPRGIFLEAPQSK